MVSKSALVLSLSLAALASSLVIRGESPALVRNTMHSLWAFSSRGLGPEELAKMEGSIETLLSTGKPDAATVIAIEQMRTIVKTIIPSRKKAQERDQKVLDAKYAEFKTCVEAKNGPAPHDGPFEKTKAYKETLAKHKPCFDKQETRSMLKDSHCYSIDEEKVCKGDISPANKKCCDAHAEHQRQVAECAPGQKELMEHKRKAQLETNRKNACKSTNACLDEKAESYKQVEQNAKKAEKRRSWQALYRIKCLLDASDGKKLSEKKAKECKKKKHDVPKITYRKLPTKKCCDSKEKCAARVNAKKEAAKKAVEKKVAQKEAKKDFLKKAKKAVQTMKKKKKESKKAKTQAKKEVKEKAKKDVTKKAKKVIKKDAKKESKKQVKQNLKKKATKDVKPAVKKEARKEVKKEGKKEQKKEENKKVVAKN